MKLAINGFGRIGRQFYRIAQNHPKIEIVAINDLTDRETLAHLLKYDSVYGKFEGELSGEILAEKEPVNLPWKKLNIDVVIESTGRFTDREGAEKHLQAGAKKVIVSAPAKDPDVTLVLGVNDETYNPQEHRIISMASCTTNCAAPVAKVLDVHFWIKRAVLTTIHSYTSTQNLVDGPHKDLRRSRAAAVSAIPTTTGAAKSVVDVIPNLDGKLDAVAIRIPIPTVSLVDFAAEVEKPTDVEEVNGTFTKEALRNLMGILAVSEEPLVSVDYTGNPYSAIVDLPFTRVVGKNLVKVLAWYDNEWGYSSRLVDLAAKLASEF